MARNVLDKIEADSPVTEPGTAWFNAVTNVLNTIDIEYGDELSISRPSKNGMFWKITIPTPTDASTPSTGSAVMPQGSSNGQTLYWNQGTEKWVLLNLGDPNMFMMAGDNATEWDYAVRGPGTAPGAVTSSHVYTEVGGDSEPAEGSYAEIATKTRPHDVADGREVWGDEGSEVTRYANVTIDSEEVDGIIDTWINENLDDRVADLLADPEEGEEASETRQRIDEIISQAIGDIPDPETPTHAEVCTADSRPNANIDEHDGRYLIRDNIGTNTAGLTTTSVVDAENFVARDAYNDSNSVPVLSVQQLITAYTKPDTSDYTGIDNEQEGSVYATVADLNDLRAEVQKNADAFDSLRSALLTHGMVAVST